MKVYQVYVIRDRDPGYGKPVNIRNYEIFLDKEKAIEHVESFLFQIEKEYRPKLLGVFKEIHEAVCLMISKKGDYFILEKEVIE